MKILQTISSTSDSICIPKISYELDTVLPHSFLSSFFFRTRLPQQRGLNASLWYPTTRVIPTRDVN
jgi:hypothetical protein